VALAVISISSVALLNCQTVSLRTYLRSQILSRATLLAEEKINEIEAKGISEIDDQEGDEYENGLLYVTVEGEFYDEEETELYQPEWRLDYWWRTTIEETEYDGVRKVVVEVFFERFGRAPMDTDRWDNEQISPTVTLITYVASTNRREDARSGSAAPSRSGRRSSRVPILGDIPILGSVFSHERT
jgi:hypothetical protein